MVAIAPNSLISRQSHSYGGMVVNTCLDHAEYLAGG